jgi:hypothetical protein
MRSELTSGRARQRRKFTSVPEMAKVSFLFNDAEGMAFESWYRQQLADGANWFEAKLKTPLGLEYYTCRFTDIYQGPNPVGPPSGDNSRWSYSAEIELFERAVLGDDWGLFPDFVIDASIFDKAINREWPLNPWQTYADVMDTAINEDWPNP